MKSFVIILGVLCLGIAATITYTNLKSSASAPVAETNTAPGVATDSASPVAGVSSRTISSSASNSHRQSVLAVTRPAGARSSDPAAVALQDRVAALVSPDSTFQQREAVWKQLGTVEQLDEVINALKDGATKGSLPQSTLAAERVRWLMPR